MPRADRVFLAGLVSSVLLMAGTAWGQGIPALDQKLTEARDEPVTLTADSLEYESKRDVYIARGNVVIVQGERTLRADWIAFNAETGAGVASGHVELVEGTDTLRADFVEFDTRSLEGVIREGSLDSPASRFRTWGSEIQKTGENTYTFKNGVFTTCRCPKEDDTEPWRLRAQEAEVEVGGYGTLHDATVEVLGVPVFWMPWMIYPIKTERQSGFLFPELAIASRDGFGAGLPFFWAVDDQVNLTLTPEWTTKRGFKGATELEYVFGERSLGDATFAFGYDEKIDPNSRRDPFDRERWVAGGEHFWYLPGAVRFDTDYAFASDNQVPLDYDELSAARADRYLESRASIGRSFGSGGRFGGVTSAWFADDLQNPDDIDRDKVLLQRWPHVQAEGLPGAIPGLPFLQPSLDAEYTWFSALDSATGALGFLDTGVDGVSNRDERQREPTLGSDPYGDRFDPVTNPEGTERDGSFQEGEPLTDSGHRVVLHPRLAAPFRLGRFAELYPEVGWQQTFYDSQQRDAEQRGLLTGRVDLRSRLRRHYDNDLVHVVEPVVGWAYVSHQRQSDNPLFVPATAVPQRRLRGLDLDNVTRDTADRIDEVNELSFGVTQRLFGDIDEERPDRPRALRGDVTLLGLYDLERGQMEDVLLDGRVTPWWAGDLRFHLSLLPRETKPIREGMAEWTWSHRDGHAVSTTYRYIRDIPLVFEDFGTGDRFDNARSEDHVNELSTNVRIAVTRQWTASYRMAYSFETDLLIGNRGLIEYLSKCGCWALGAEFSEDRARGVEVKILYRIVGLGKDQDPNRGGLLDW
jgi:LPS-assembly protein